MEKRLILALLLSFVVLTVWRFYFAPKQEPPPTTPSQVTAPVSDAQVNAPAPPDTRPKIGEVVGDSEERTLELRIGTPGTVGSYFARFSNRGARLLDLRLGNFYDRVGLKQDEKLDLEHWTSLIESAESSGARTGSMTLRSDASAKDLEREPLEHALWRMREIENGVEFDLAQGSGVRLVKRIRFEPGTYQLRVELEVENLALEGRAGERVGYLFCAAEVVPLEAQDRFYVEPQAIAAGRTREDAGRKLALPVTKSVPRDDKGQPQSGSFEIPADEVSFAGVHNKYFACLMRGAEPFSTASISGARWRRLRDDAFARSHPDKADRAWKFVATDLVLSLEVPPKGERKSYGYFVYAGPKDPKTLLADHRDHEVLLDADLGSFCGLPMAGIGNVLLWILRMFHRLVGNWGVAIILLTICVRLALFPVNRRSQTAMARFQKKMKRLQPQIDELKKRYADDPAKQREEQQKMMAREGMVPPLGGCLPMFVQIPIFFGLFSALRTAFELRQAPFALWIVDLSKPDGLLEINWHLPWIGNIQWLNLLPLLMVVLWVLQQKMMPTPADEQAARMQKMMMFMPVVMGFFLYDYAAGLSLYMITQSSLGIVEQSVIKKVWPVDDNEPVKAEGHKSWFQRLMERAQEAQRMQEKRRRGEGGGGGGGKKKQRK